MIYLRLAPSKSEEKGGYSNSEILGGRLDQMPVNLIAEQQALLDKINAAPLNDKDRSRLIERVFDHSVADGLKLAEKKQYTNRDYLELISRPQFFIKHAKLAEGMLGEAKTGVKTETDEKELQKLTATFAGYEKKLELGDGRKLLAEEPAGSLPTRELLDEVDNWYAQFLKTEKVEAAGERDPRSKGERLGEAALEQIKLALEKNYYSSQVIEAVIRHLSLNQPELIEAGAKKVFAGDKALKEKYKASGTEAYLKNVNKGTEDKKALGLAILGNDLSEKELEAARFSWFLPEETVKKIAAAYGISDERKLAKALYQPLNLTAKRRIGQAEKELVGEISATGNKIVWNETTQRYESGTAKKEKPATKYLTDDKILDELEKLFQAGEDRNSIASGLAGCDSERAWALRDKLIRAGADGGIIVQSLAGCDSDRAWKMRDDLLLKKGGKRDDLAVSLAGLDSDRAWQFRDKLIEAGEDKLFIIFCLAGCDSDRAWQFREDYLENHGDGTIGSSLAGLDSERAWKMRDKLFSSRAPLHLKSQSLIGLDSDRAWKLREELLRLGIHKNEMAADLAGLDSERAWKMREEFIGSRDFDVRFIAKSLVGLNSERAWKMREDILQYGVSQADIASGLSGDHVSFVWRLQKKEEVPSSTDAGRKLNLLNLLNNVVPVKIEAEKETKIEEQGEYLSEDMILDKLEEYYQNGIDKHYIAHGLIGLDSDRAWLLRDKVFQDGASQASVALGLAGCDSERAWEMRNEFIRLGLNKNFIVESTSGLDSERAWKFREEFFEAGTVSSGYIAVSLAGLDSERAWKMRDKLLQAGADNDLVAEGLVGCDSNRAWKLREDFFKKGVSITFFAKGLAGLDSERAWEWREKIYGSVDPTSLAEGLAGLDSERAWEWRDRLLSDMKNPEDILLSLGGLNSKRAWELRTKYFGNNNVALSLAGSYGGFVWQLNEENIRETKAETETKYLSEDKILDTLEEYYAGLKDETMNEWSREETMACSLAGCDSERAWRIRDSLIARGVDKQYIFEGLVGCDSERAWKFREEYIQNNTTNLNLSTAFEFKGLAGLDSDRAWKMRDELLQKGIAPRIIMMSLAGCDSERAWRFRDRFLSEDGEVLAAARSLSGLDSDRAWKMRDELMIRSNGVLGCAHILESLSGLDSERAWRLREEEYAKDPDLGDSVARGMAGLDSERAWKLRVRIFENPNEGVALTYFTSSLAGLDSPQAWSARSEFTGKGAKYNSMAASLAGDATTFVWQLKRNKKENKQNYQVQPGVQHETSFDEHKLLEQISQYLQNDSLLAADNKQTIREKMQSAFRTGKSLVFAMNAILKETPGVFLDTLAAKKDSRLLAGKLAGKAFPSVLTARANPWRNFSGYFGFNAARGADAGAPRPENYLNPNRNDEMFGGDPEAGSGASQEVMRFREPVNDLVVTGIYGRMSGQTWDGSYQFPVAKPVMEKARETTITLPAVGTQVRLPKLINSSIIPERVKGINKGQETLLEVEISPLREGTVRDTKKAEEIVYSIEIDELPKAMLSVASAEYESFRDRFVRANGLEMTKALVDLPEEIDLFLASLKNREPKEQVQEIEKFVRSICHYDFKNKEVMSLKRGKSLEERLEIMEARAEELRGASSENKEKLAGQKYAGVCADFAVLTAAILRRAGFASGVLSGFMPEGRSAKVEHAHATAFVVWPNAKKENEIFSVDGTPTGIRGISRPSLVEQEVVRAEKTKELEKEAEKQLDEIMKTIGSYDEAALRELSNGKLENVLNTVLRYGVKQENLKVITTILEAYWYTPVSKINLNKTDGQIDFLKFFENEAERARQEAPAEREAEPGSKLLETIELFLQRFSKDSDSKQGFAILEKINNLAGKSLAESERKALTVTIAYLQAKKVK